MHDNARGVATRPRVKLHDVARVAGVSAQTVSRVVRNAPGVSKETRTRVARVITEMEYRPNLAARSLSASRVGSVHVVVAASLYHGTTTAFVAICEALAARGLATSTSVVHDRSEHAKAVSVSADGVIVLGGTREPPTWLEALTRRVPVVYVGRTEGLPDGITGVMVDQVLGARLAIEHLVARGCRHLAHIAGPQDWYDARVRLQTFEATAAEFAVTHEVHSAGSWEASDALAIAGGLSTEVDGVFAANDHLALGFLSHCREAAIDVPASIKVVGVDNTAGSDAYPPPLTTVNQDFQLVGDAAVTQMWRALQGERTEHVVLPPELVIRASS